MFVYILRSLKDNSYYVGMASDPEKRLAEHNSGKVQSTRSKLLWERVHLEEYEDISGAREREKYLKSAAGRRYRKYKLGLN